MLRFKDFLISEESMIGLLDSDKEYSTSFEFIKSVESKGVKILGEGYYGYVLHHPSWGDKVLKIFSQDDSCYIRFSRFCYSNPSPHLPKVYVKPKRFIPNWGERFFKDSYLYYTVIEKLEPVSQNEYIIVAELSNKFKELYNTVVVKPKYDGDKNALDSQIEFNENDIKSFISDKNISKRNVEFSKYLSEFKRNFLNPFDKSNDCWSDIHKGNIMKRSNGEYVITDPYAPGVSLETKIKDDYTKKGKQFTLKQGVLKGNNVSKFKNK